MKKYWLVILGFLLIALGFSVFYLTSLSSPVVLRLAYSKDNAENVVLKDLLQTFQKSHPNIKVELVEVPFGNYNELIENNFSGSSTPDILYVNTFQFPFVNSLGLLEPLDSFINNDPNFHIKDYYSSIIDYFTIDEHLFVSPKDISTIGILYYNKTEFDAAKLAYPNENWNWKDFINAAQRLTRFSKLEGWKDHIDQYGFVEGYFMLEPWVYSSGGRWVDNPKKPGRWTFNTSEFIRGIQFRADLMNKYKVMLNIDNVATVWMGNDYDSFLSGSAAMLLLGTWNIPMFKMNIKKFNWGITLVPKGPTGLRGYEMVGEGYGILKTSRHKNEAWDLVSFLTGNEGEMKFAGIGEAIPALQSIANSSAYLSDVRPEIKETILRSIQFGVFSPMISNKPDLELGLSKVWLGKESAEEGVSELYNQVKDKPISQ